MGYFSIPESEEPQELLFCAAENLELFKSTYRPDVQLRENESGPAVYLLDMAAGQINDARFAIKQDFARELVSYTRAKQKILSQVDFLMDTIRLNYPDLINEGFDLIDDVVSHSYGDATVTLTNGVYKTFVTVKL